MLWPSIKPVFTQVFALYASSSAHIYITNMAHNVLITGGSGYLGGTLLNRLPAANILPSENVYASVRSESQAEGVRAYGFKPLTFDFSDAAAIRDAVVDNKLTVVYFLTDAVNHEAQVNFIKALAIVKEQTGRDVHFLHVSQNYSCGGIP